MVVENDIFCPDCGGALKYYDSVDRITKREYGQVKHIKMRRFVCSNCGKSHRELPNNILPFKRYTSNIITGFINGDLTVSNIEFEDFPCDMTVKRWIKQYK